MRASLRFCPMILAALLVLLAAVPATATISAPEGRHSHTPVRGDIPHDPDMERAVRESGVEKIVVKHEGWRETLPSFARLKIHEVTGRTRLRGQDPSYTVLSMLFENGRWYTAPILPVGHPEVGRLLGVEETTVSASQVIDNPRVGELVHRLEEAADRRDELNRLTRLANAVEQVHRLGTEDRVFSMFEPDGIPASELRALSADRELRRELHRERDALSDVVRRERPFLRAGEELIHRARVLTALPGEFLVVPDSESVDNRWVRPVSFSADRASNVIRAGQDFERALSRSFANADPDALMTATRDFLNVAELSRLYPSSTFRSVQNFYVENNLWRWSALVYLLSACVFGLYFFFGRSGMYWTAVGLLGGGFVLHTAAMILRTYLRSYESVFRMPVSNMFESITFFAWAVLAIAVVWETVNRRGLIGVAATSVGFLFLTGASMMPLHETRIHPLRAVLNSYWLNIHVTMMLLSYAAFAIAAVFAVVYLVKYMLGRESLFGGKPIMSMEQTEEFAYRLVQLGWPLLTLGVALGAVWADHAWGRYWGWDPKETWAFITWVGYTIYLHTRIVLGWRGKWSALACVIGFVLVLITWLGVSYLPWFSGGLHTYASPN